MPPFPHSSSPCYVGPYCSAVLWNLWYGVRVVQSTLQALFRSTIARVVIQGFRSSSVPVTHEGYLVKSRRPLRFGSSQANRSALNTELALPLAAVSHAATSIISLRLGSSASLSSPFSSFCTLLPTVLLVFSLEQQWLHEPTCNVEILYRAQMGQDVYIYGIRTYHIYI